MNRVSELEKGYLSGHPNKPLISQVTLLRAGKEKGQFLREQPRSPDTNLTVCLQYFSQSLPVTSPLLYGPRKALSNSFPTSPLTPSSPFPLLLFFLKIAGNG